MLPRYTNFKLYDPTIREQEFTLKYRQQLLQYELNKFKSSVSSIKSEINRYGEVIKTKLDNADLQTAVFDKLQNLCEQFQAATSSRITNKLNNLYRDTVLLPQRTQSYVNLSSTELTSAQTEVLSLGCKFSYKPKFDSLKQQTEMEI
ncbi:hypothetical protein FHG87_022605, partial [Trinorchestia longiramus]